MRLLDFRITLFNSTFFLRLFCQYPGVFYFVMVSATILHHDLLCWTIKRSQKAPDGPKDVNKFLSALSSAGN